MAGNYASARHRVESRVTFVFCCRFMGELNGRIGLFPANHTEEDEQKGEGYHQTQGNQLLLHECPPSETQGSKCIKQRAEKTMHMTLPLTR